MSDEEETPELPEVDWEQFQQQLRGDLVNVEMNIRAANLRGDGNSLFAFAIGRAQIITALGICELNKPKVFT